MIARSDPVNFLSEFISISLLNKGCLISENPAYPIYRVLIISMGISYSGKVSRHGGEFELRVRVGVRKGGGGGGGE